MSSMLACVLSTLAAAPLPDGWQTRPLTDEDLIEFSSEELRQLRNEIYARHGYVFKSADLAEYFRQQPWYKPKPAFNPAGAGAVSPTEKANVELIKRIEDGRREYEAIDDRSQVFIKGGLPVLSEAKAALATIKEDGSLEASPYELTAKLSCRFDTKTPTSKKCGCGHRLDIYDHRLRIRVASESAGLPPAYAFVHCAETMHFSQGGLLSLGELRGQLLEIRYYSPDGQGEFLARKRYFALTSKGELREVADVIAEILFPVKRGKDSSGNEVYSRSDTKIDALPRPDAQPPALRLTTRTETLATPVDPPSGDILGKMKSRQEVRVLPWSADNRKFKESGN